MHTSVLNSRVILIVRKRVQQTVLDSWRRKGLRENNRWRLRTKCISQVNSSVTWANTMPTLVINCRVVLIYSIVRLISHDQIAPRGGELCIWKDGDACRKFWIKPLKETDLGVAQAFLTPKRDHIKTQTKHIFLHFFTCDPKRNLHG